MTSRFDPETVTVLHVRRLIAKCLLEGRATRCPCCKRDVNMRRGHISASMARSILKAYHAGPREPFQCTEVDARDRNGDYAKLRFWGLITQAREHPKGWWRLTALGRAFARGDAEVPKYIATYNKRLHAVFGDPVSIVDCLTRRGGSFEAEVAQAKALARQK